MCNPDRCCIIIWHILSVITIRWIMFYAEVPAVYNSLIRRDIDKDARYTVTCSFAEIDFIDQKFPLVS